MPDLIALFYFCIARKFATGSCNEKAQGFLFFYWKWAHSSLVPCTCGDNWKYSAYWRCTQKREGQACLLFWYSHSGIAVQARNSSFDQHTLANDRHKTILRSGSTERTSETIFQFTKRTESFRTSQLYKGSVNYYIALTQWDLGWQCLWLNIIHTIAPSLYFIAIIVRS